MKCKPMKQQELPGLTGFSETGIKDMRIFYEAWAPYIDRQLPVAELDQIMPIADFENRQPSVADLTESDIECFFRVLIRWSEIGYICRLLLVW